MVSMAMVWQDWRLFRDMHQQSDQKASIITCLLCLLLLFLSVFTGLFLTVYECWTFVPIGNVLFVHYDIVLVDYAGL